MTMTEPAIAASPTRQTSAPRGPSPTQSVEALTLITEQQVLFSTAVAVPVPAPKTHRLSDAVHAVAGAVHAMVASLHLPPPRQHYPGRYDLLEDSRMAREMDRL